MVTPLRCGAMTITPLWCGVSLHCSSVVLGYTCAVWCKVTPVRCGAWLHLSGVVLCRLHLWSVPLGVTLLWWGAE